MFWVFYLFLYLLTKSNHIAAFALNLKSTYEGENAIFGLLSLADLAQNDVIPIPPRASGGGNTEQ
jgi:hypothetical protein